MYITDYTHYKKNYFTALKKYVIRTVKNEPAQSNEADHEFDELLSSI